MKVFNSKLAAIGLAAFVFASCSDSTSDPTDPSGGIIPKDLTSVTLTSQDVDNSRVVNYKNSTANARKFFLTRAGETNFITGMPKDKDIPVEEKYTVLNKKVASDLIGEDGKAFAIKDKQTIDFSGKTIKNATIFIHPGSTMKYNATAGGNTFVLEGNARLEYTGTGVMVAENDIVYVKKAIGELAATGDMVINGTLYADLRSTSEAGKELTSGLGAIKEQTKAEKEESITPTQNITFGPGAKAYINGSIRAINLKVENGAYVYAKANLFNNDNNGNATINGNLWIRGFIKTRTLDVNGYLKAEAAIKATNAFNVNNGANVEATYINVTNNTKDGDNNVIRKGEATLSLSGTGKITIGNTNVIIANNLVTDNKSKGQITLEGNDAVAVIKAHKFTNNGDSKIVALATPGTNSTFLLQFQENHSASNEYNTFEDLDIAANYADYDKVYDPKTANVTLVEQNHKKYGYKWSGDPATIASQAKLDLIASEESANGQSATCIQSANNKLYVSYHTYGDKKFGGNIEVLSMTGNQLHVDANKAAENYDYNHLIVDGNSLYLAGSGTKSAGAFLGKVDLNGGNLGEEVKLYAIDNKTKMDANCVAAFDGNHIVATTKGLTSFDEEFSHWNKTGDEGKSVVVANGKLYTLDVKGNVNVYENKNLEVPILSVNVGEVTPTNNKAVLAVDESNGTIYVCKGENGVAKISSTGDVKPDFFSCPTFTNPKKTDLTGKVKGRANGIAVGGEYIYVACGGYGLVVLDKEGHVVCHRKANAYNANDNSGSANYVTVDIVNGEEYAFVAYGQNRVQVFKVTKTTTKQ